MRICVLQSDNRPKLDFLLKTQKVNKLFCSILKYDYAFVKIDDSKHLHPATKKIHIVNEFLKKPFDVLVFLDSDAWIQNGFWLDIMIRNLINSNKHGCFSRDPYLKKNTFINSGSFIIKNNEYTKQMYTTLVKNLIDDTSHHHKPFFDQYYISNYVFNNKKDFVIFIPDILNTPAGKVLRHNWYKDEKMHHDLEKLMSTLLQFIKNPRGKIIFNETKYYDNKVFPNKLENGYEYKALKVLKHKKKQLNTLLINK